MNETILTVKLRNLSSYLLLRARLRCFGNRSKAAYSVSQSILGRTVELNLTDVEQRYLAADCVREPENLFVYRAIADSNLADTFIDIGANCGHVAASIVPYYARVMLFEPNPKLARLLRMLFGDYLHVTVHECAIVNSASACHLSLTVPDESSGLATLGETHLSNQHKRVHTYRVKASTLAAELGELSAKTAYIKIDVEGSEESIIESAKELIDNQRPLVGFEALSIEAALKCSQLFDNYVFYCSRFDFLESDGALSTSIFKIFKALVTGGNITILEIKDFNGQDLTNFSQIYSVPREKKKEFEKAITDYAEKTSSYNLARARTWSCRSTGRH